MGTVTPVPMFKQGQAADHGSPCLHFLADTLDAETQHLSVGQKK
jgi:hypothetical protein